MRRTAFTLLELLLVLGIIMVITGIGVAGYQRQYARSQFKNGVIQMQVDLSCARVLAMQTGCAYVFRYVPGSGVYEIAPLRTLQETLYRVNGDLENSASDDSLGGSLATSVGGFDPAFSQNSASGMNSFGDGGFAMDPSSTALGSESLGTASMYDVSASGSGFGLGTTPVYTDDLFSPENIAADMAEAMRANARDARLGTTNVDLTGGLGGSLNSIAGDTANMASGIGNNNAAFAGTTVDAAGHSLGYASDFSGTGGQFALGGDMSTGQGPAMTQTLRELNGSEKMLADENTLMSRVNLDGVIVRKQLRGEVVFTFMRVSDSTPAPLRARRPGGVRSDSADPVTGMNDGEDLGSRLGGSLRSIPTPSGGEGLSGGLNAIAGTEQDNSNSETIQEEDPLANSLWSEPLIFFPNGKTSNAILGFASVGEFSFYSEISLRGMTGVSRISSISKVPPGSDPNMTALTQEQLFRLYNPGGTYDPNAANAAQGGALQSTATGGALGGDDSVNAAAVEGLAASGNADALATSTPQTPTVNYGRAGGGYGSSERRSGYSFNTTPNNAAVGVDAPQEMTNALNGAGANTGNLGNANAGTQGADPFAAIDTALGGTSDSANTQGGEANAKEQENGGGAL